MIRDVKTSDHDELLAVAESSGLFGAEELERLGAMLKSFHAGNGTPGEFWLTDDDSGLMAIAYCAPERMTHGTWNLYLIAVRPERQRQGRGARLLRQVEERLRSLKARVLLVETLDIPDFEYVRAFYRAAGFVQEARIRDFYDAGQDKIVFWKSLASAG